MKAVVMTGINEFAVEEVELSAPEKGEIRVEVKATGLCHSDISSLNGTLPSPTPIVLGHEGAGVVVELGEGVSKFALGDHVVFTLQPVCGVCGACMDGKHVYCETATTESILGGLLRSGKSPFTRPGGEQVYTYAGLGCMAEETVVHESSAIKVDQSYALDRACLVGCGVVTGAGGAIFGGDITAGDSVVILGCGGVGLAAVQGAAIAGAKNIIAVDVADNKLQMAKDMGATHIINGKDGDAVEQVLRITGRGADVTLECAGVGPLIAQGFDMLRAGGVMVVIGIPPMDVTLPISAAALVFSGRTVKGGKFGCHNPVTDIPMLLEFYQQGRLDLDSMVSKTYSIDEAPQLFADMESNTNARGVIVF